MGVIKGKGIERELKKDRGEKEEEERRNLKQMQKRKGKTLVQNGKETKERKRGFKEWKNFIEWEKKKVKKESKERYDTSF